MTEPQQLKPLKTWSHLAARRRKPSEYEIVSANLHYNDRDPDSPYELSPGMFMNEWYKKNTFATPLKHDDWNAFRGGVPGSGVTACGSEVFAVEALQGLHGGREVGGSSEIFGKVAVATLQPNHEEDPDDPRQDAAFRAA